MNDISFSNNFDAFYLEHGLSYIYHEAPEGPASIDNFHYVPINKRPKALYVVVILVFSNGGLRRG